jgi:hypothetical protein
VSTRGQQVPQAITCCLAVNVVDVLGPSGATGKPELAPVAITNEHPLAGLPPLAGRTAFPATAHDASSVSASHSSLSKSIAS